MSGDKYIQFEKETLDCGGIHFLRFAIMSLDMLLDTLVVRKFNFDDVLMMYCQIILHG